VKTRTVTLDGDVFDPAGTLSGGKIVSLMLAHSDKRLSITCRVQRDWGSIPSRVRPKKNL